MNEADTCRKFVVPKLVAAGWDNEPHSIAEQRTFTDGRILSSATRPGGFRRNAQTICSVTDETYLSRL
jgi:hypothetical protein